ncbi:MAG: ATP-binding protein [Lachnospira pectinoschiza]
MKLISLHIDNFGQFNNFDYVFEDGINQIIEENGWGKSTLAAFIKVMFFGFDNTSKRDDYVNEKRRFKPWQGGLYGGSLAFEIDNKQYTIYRTFEAKDKDDTFKLVDTITKLDSFDYTSDIGKEIFEIDSDSFEKTAYIFQNNCESGSTGDIAALLGCDAVDDVDVNNYDEVIGHMNDKINSLSPKRKTGQLYKMKEDIERLKAKLMGKNELEQALQQTISLITEQKKEYNRLDKEQTSVSDILDKASRRKDLLAFKEQYDIYNSQLAERYTAYKQYEEEYSKLPSVEKLSIQFSNLDELNKISIQLKHIELSSSEKERLDSLEEKLSNVTDKEIDYYMKAYNKMSSLYQDIKDTRAHLTANYEAVYDKPEKSSPAITIAAAIIGIILIAAGIIIPSLAVITFLLGIVCIMGGIAYGLVNKNRYKNNMRTYNIRNEQYDIIKEKLDTLTKQYNKLQHDIDEWISAIVPEHNIDDTYYELMQLSQQKKELSMLRDRELKYNKRLKEYNVTAIIGSINTFMSDYMEHTAIPDIQGFDNAINECISKLNSIRQRINYIEQYRKSYMDADNAFKRFRQNNVNYEQQLSMLRELDDMPDYDITELNAQLNNIRSGMELCSNTINEYNSRLNSKENELDELSSYESQLNGLEADYETLLANYNNLLKAKDYLEKARISYAKKYQAPVNAKFKEYFDIVSDNTDSNMYSFDIHNNLLKNEAGQYREIRFLSSGCKDLAGICMRFAFIDSMYKDKKPFIILDDPFVNMDTFSINNAHRLIEKLAKKYQILYFTCHNSRTMK